jgi:EpsI family protein
MKKQVYVSLAILIFGGILGNLLRFTETKPKRGADFSVIPLQTEQYYGREYPFSDATDEVLKADLATNRGYAAADGSQYQLFVAYFGSQKYGSQIHSPKHCLPGGGWRIETIEPFKLPLPNGQSKIVNYSVISDSHNKIVMFYWFETRSGSIRNEYGLKFDLAKNALFFRPTDAAIVRVTVDSRTSVEEAKNKGIAFINYFYPQIERSLPF